MGNDERSRTVALLHRAQGVLPVAQVIAVVAMQIVS
jgi:hypothetical protein